MVGAKLAGTLGQPVVIANRGGAGGTTTAAGVAKSDPDGSTDSTSFKTDYDFRSRTLKAFTGRLKPLRTSSSVNSMSARNSIALKTLMSIRICPFFASSQI
jgi:tripartite-type tricarboxylate transporter receptor subunit TctC